MTAALATGIGPDRARLYGRVLPPLAIAAMALVVRTAPAMAHPRIAALLFLWVAADALTLGLVAQHRRPAARHVLATLAGGATAAWVLSPAALKDSLRTMPWVCMPMLMLVGAHALLRLWRAGMVATRTGLRDAAGWRALVGEIAPAPLAAVMVAEARLLHLALFRWNAPPEVPAGTRAFTYHRHLRPMMIAFLILCTIEASVTHLLIAHWSRTAALILFAVSDLSIVYVIGLIKSLRLYPVLLTTAGVRIRFGLLTDHVLPYDAVAGIVRDPSGGQVTAPETDRIGLLAWPNLLVELATPLPRASWLRARRPATAIALRLDDPEGFMRLLRWRIGNAGDGLQPVR